MDTVVDIINDACSRRYPSSLIQERAIALDLPVWLCVAPEDRVTDPRARGLALGVASHGIGTARALQEGQTQGAFAGLGMGLTGLVISLSVTGLIPV